MADQNAIISAGIELAAELSKLVVRAIAAQDVRTMRRVSDVLPGNTVLRSRLALLEAEIEAEEILSSRGIG